MNEIFYLISSIGISFIIAFFTIPVIVKVVKLKQLYDTPDDRSATNRIVPTLGGVAIFLGFTLATILSSKGIPFAQLKYIIGGLIILLFIGVKDDLLVISPKKKFAAEVSAALMLIVFADIRFTSLHGFLGIHEIPYLASILLTAFVVIVIINAFNLIDGVDGLASGISLLISATFGVWFSLAGHYAYAILAFALTGGLAAYFYFNVYGSDQKIFMGDTGSLVLGFIISVMVIQFNEYNIQQSSQYAVKAAPAVSIGILVIPLFDTLRVFIIRMTKRMSPFHPDKNHIHHLLLELNMTHLQVTLALLGANIFFIGLSLFFTHIGIGALVFINLVLAVAFSLVIDALSKNKRRKAVILYKEAPVYNKLHPDSVKVTSDRGKTNGKNGNGKAHTDIKSLMHKRRENKLLLFHKNIYNEK